MAGKVILNQAAHTIIQKSPRVTAEIKNQTSLDGVKTRNHKIDSSVFSLDGIEGEVAEIISLVDEKRRMRISAGTASG